MKAVAALPESTYDSSRVVALHSIIRVYLYIGMSKDCFVTLRQAIAPLSSTVAGCCYHNCQNHHDYHNYNYV